MSSLLAELFLIGDVGADALGIGQWQGTGGGGEGPVDSDGLDLPETTTLENIKEILRAFKAWDTAGAVALADLFIFVRANDSSSGA